ncbi:MAG: glycolate oxidase binding subunit [Thermomicrobiales bacterium]|jgi:glycolate oxidase FAD binding subunit|nr:glycolate oxidase binding subunit [Thermomicrobiales bacterium]
MPNQTDFTLTTVDGYTPIRIVEPERPSDVAEVLADAAAEGLAVTPIGGGTSLGLGNVPERLDIGLSTNRLRGIIDYEPADLTLSVAAGSPFADVQAVLAEHGQTLPIEVPHPDRATIGGLIATALAGPRRYGAGTLRDLLIGVSAAHPSGTVTKAGGMVVKNVTGFDLMRLYLGSLGTLGVLVSANFKVLPLPRFEATLLVTYSALAPALDAANRIRVGRVQPVSLEVAQAGSDSWLLSARIEGREATVRLLAAEARELAAGDATLLEARESAIWWSSYVADQEISVGPSEALIRCTSQPSATSSLVSGALSAATDGILLKRAMASPGLGALLLRVGLPAVEPKSTLRRFRDALLAVADHVVIMAAEPDLKHEVDVWGRTPETIDVMRSIKQEFDPHRVLNPGRFAGFL